MRLCYSILKAFLVNNYIYVRIHVLIMKIKSVTGKPKDKKSSFPEFILISTLIAIEKNMYLS